MAFALKGTGSASTANSVTADQASLVVTTATTAGAAGDLAVLLYAVDNNQTTDGDEVAVTAVTDSGGNQWKKAVEFTNGQGTAQTGATCGIWYSNLSAAISIGGTVTLTFSNATSRDATAASLTYYTKAAGFNASLAVASGTLANDAAAAGSLDVTTDGTRSFLRVRGIASESNVVTALTSTVGWNLVTQAVAVIAAATSMGIRGETIITTATSAASTPTAGAGAVDNASVYAAFTEVPTTVPREFSLPPALTKRGLTVAQQASGLFLPIIQPTLQNTRWLTPLSEPTRRVRTAQPTSGLFSPVIQSPLGWLAPLSQPVYRVKIAQTVGLFSPVVQPPVTAVTTGWLAAFSEPVRVVKAPKVNLFPFSAQAASQVSIDWLTPLSEPVRVRTSPANQQVLAFAPNPIVATGWSAPLSEPARAKQRAIADYAYAPLAISEVVTIDKWFNPLADPARKLRPITSPADFTPLFTENSIALNTRFSSLIEPTRVRARPTESPALAFVQAAPFAESVTEDRWHQPWSDPPRPRQGLSTANQQALAFVATVAAAPAPPESWFAPLSDPTRRIAAAQKVNLFPFTAARVVAVETITVDKWFVSFTNPVRVKPQLATGLQQALAYVEAAPFAETVTESRWHQPWSEPLRSKPGLSAANQATFFAPSTVITSEVVTVDKWFAPLSDPPRAKAALAAANQVAFFAPSTVITAEIVTADKWFEQLSDPTRRKPGDRDRYKAENEFTAIAASMKWFAPLNEPVRQRQALSVAHQRSYFASLVVTTPELITVDKWFKSFTDPVRVKIPTDDRYLGENNWTAVDATINWINLPLAEPVRTKSGLSAAARQPALTWPAQIIIPSLTSWWRPLAEPPKAKAGLLTANQRFETRTADFIPHPDRFLEGWFNWFSEPVRKLPQLNAALQQAHSAPDRRPVLATITVTMAVTETNDDVALFAIKVFAGNPPATAVVSLVEIGHGASLTSIVEEGDDGSGTSIVES